MTFQNFKTVLVVANVRLTLSLPVPLVFESELFLGLGWYLWFLLPCLHPNFITIYLPFKRIQVLIPMENTVF